MSGESRNSGLEGTDRILSFGLERPKLEDLDRLSSQQKRENVDGTKSASIFNNREPITIRSNINKHMRFQRGDFRFGAFQPAGWRGRTMPCLSPPASTCLVSSKLLPTTTHGHHVSGR